MTQEDFDQTVKSGQYDTYPLTVEEYETAETVAENVEVEQFFLLTQNWGSG